MDIDKCSEMYLHVKRSDVIVARVLHRQTIDIGTPSACAFCVCCWWPSLKLKQNEINVWWRWDRCMGGSTTPESIRNVCENMSMIVTSRLTRELLFRMILTKIDCCEHQGNREKKYVFVHWLHHTHTSIPLTLIWWWESEWLMIAKLKIWELSLLLSLGTRNTPRNHL